MVRVKNILRVFGLFYIALSIAFIILVLGIKQAQNAPDVTFLKIVLVAIGLIPFFIGFMFFIHAFKNKWQEATLLTIISTMAVVIVIAAAIIIPSGGATSNWHDPNTRFDPYLGWSLIPSNTVDALFFYGEKSITANAHGFRSAEVDPDMQHVIILGDSVAFGLGADNHETVSAYLQNAIPDYQVQNLAVSGYGVDQSLINLERNIGKLNPVFIIYIIYTGNDLADTSSDVAYGKSKPLYRLENDEVVLVKDKVARYSCANVWATSWMLNKFEFLSKHKDSICGTTKMGEFETKKVVSILIDNIKLKSQQYGAQTLFVISPDKSDFENKSEELIFFQELLDQKGYMHLDMYEALLAANESLDSIYYDSAHFYSRGNAFLASQILQYVANQANQ